MRHPVPCRRFRRPVPGISLKALEPAGTAANQSAGKISPAGNRAGLLAAAAPSNFPASPVLHCASAARWLAVTAAPLRSPSPRHRRGRSRRTTERNPLMAIDGQRDADVEGFERARQNAVIVPIDKTSDKAPDHRVYAGPRHEVGAGWGAAVGPIPKGAVARKSPATSSRGSQRAMWVAPSSAGFSSLTRRQRTQFGPNSGEPILRLM